MKQNILNRLFTACSRPVALAVIIAGSLSVACKKDTEGVLPEGHYPVIPASEIQAIPQENGTEAWIGGEQVVVQAVSSHDGWSTAETGIYEAAADGILTSSEPVWWKYSGEKKRVRAWYCGDGSTAKGGANAPDMPTVWTVQTDQSGDGYNASDLLFAPAKEATFAPSRIVPMRFYHQTAKIVMNVSEGGSVTSADQIQSVKIKHMALSGNWAAPVAEGATTGTWTADSDTKKDEISLHKLDNPEGTALVSYAGYAVPQAMAGLTVTVQKAAESIGSDQSPEGAEITASLPENDEALVAGDVRTYMLSIDAGNNLTIEALTLETEYTAEDLKLGDYFYSDGTTSDGGLRGIYSNGSLKMETEKPGPVSGKTVVGIVFQTDLARIGEAEKTALGYTEGDAIGLAMSLKNAGTDVTWGPQTDEPSLPNVGKHCDIYNDINGYANYTALCMAHHEDIDSYPAFKAVMDFNEIGCPITDNNTTGWFLPSGGQMWDVLQILGGCTPLADPANQTETGTGWEVKFTGVTGYIDKLNAWMESVVAGSKDVFVSGKKVGTSTERTNVNTWYWIMNSADLYLQGGSKNSQATINVRPVIAFKTVSK